MSTDERDADPIDGGIGKQRRNVVVLSMAMIVFYLAHGNVKPDQSLSIIGVSFRDPIWIIRAAWLALFYFTWRYAIVAKPLRVVVRKSVRSALHGDGYLKDLVNRSFRSSGARIPENIAENEAYVPPDLVLTSNLNPFRYRVSAEVWVTDMYGNAVAAKDRVNFRMPFLHWNTRRLYIFAREFALRREFTDYYVPYVLSLVAVLTGIFRLWR